MSDDTIKSAAELAAERAAQAAAPETETVAAKPAKKTASKVAAPAKGVVKPKAGKATPAKAEKPVAKKPAAPRKRKSTGQAITADIRLRHIELAAYYIAEKSGFSRAPADCWVAAESEVDSLLLAGKL